WELMGEIKTLRDTIAPETLLIGNGDIRDRDHGLEMVEMTGCDGIMIGRGIFHSPFGFEKVKKSHTREELLTLLRLQLDLNDQLSQTNGLRHFDPLKRFFKIYVRDFADASVLRDKLMHAKTTDEVRTLLDEFVYTQDNE
ncbi:MAG TPA: tRNA-dihydrouridine synthase, partial [Candidatus Nitrosotenuis sp.]|nr:tRNA-dihydrouridine synthase [Candidatus Nitrosotenuis sp.]